jgi:predicted transcriptional regulator
VEVSQWRQQHQDADDVYSEIGISTIKDDESDAYQQALMVARQNLAASLETEVAAIGENARRRAEAQGETDKVARFQDSTKQIVSQTLRKVKTFGPYINGQGNTYVVAYLDKNSFKKDINEYVDAVFEKTDQELNQLLGL